MADKQAFSSEYHYYDSRTFDSTYKRGDVEIFYNQNPLGDGQPITFLIPAVPDFMRDLDKTRLEIRCKITNPDGTNLGQDRVVGPVNNLIGSLFEQVSVEINGVTVTEPNNLYFLRAYLENILNYPKGVLETRALAGGWIKDTAGHLNVTDPTNAENAGLRARASLFQRSRIVTLSGNLHIDLAHTGKVIPGICPIKITLFRTSHSFCLLNAAPTAQNPQVNYKIQIMEAKLIVPSRVADPSAPIAHEKMFQEGYNMLLHTTGVGMKRYNIAAGEHSCHIPRLFTGTLPDKVAVFFVRDAALNGQYHMNPFHFERLNLNFLQLTVNSDQIPREAYEPDFANNDYISSYQTMLHHLGFDSGPDMIDLTPNEWGTGYTIYVFKLNPGPMCNAPQLKGNVNLEARFSQATPYNVSVCVFSESPATIQIDRHGEAIKS